MSKNILYIYIFPRHVQNNFYRNHLQCVFEIFSDQYESLLYFVCYTYSLYIVHIYISLNYCTKPFWHSIGMNISQYIDRNLYKQVDNARLLSKLDLLIYRHLIGKLIITITNKQTRKKYIYITSSFTVNLIFNVNTIVKRTLLLAYNSKNF